MTIEHFFEELKNLGVRKDEYVTWLEKNEKIRCGTDECLGETVGLFGDRFLEEIRHSIKCQKEADQWR